MSQAQQVLQVSQVLFPKPIRLQDLHDTYRYLLGRPVPLQVVSNILISLHSCSCEFQPILTVFNRLYFILMIFCDVSCHLL